MERRLHVRKPIQCRIEGRTGALTFLADGFDLSDSGLSFGTPVDLPLDTEVVLHYRLEEEGPMITAKVRICRQAGERYGATFVEHKAGHATGK